MGKVNDSTIAMRRKGFQAAYSIQYVESSKHRAQYFLLHLFPRSAIYDVSPELFV
jgi:hypothetical protein